MATFDSEFQEVLHNVEADLTIQQLADVQAHLACIQDNLLSKNIRWIRYAKAEFFELAKYQNQILKEQLIYSEAFQIMYNSELEKPTTRMISIIMNLIANSISISTKLIESGIYAILYNAILTNVDRLVTFSLACISSFIIKSKYSRLCLFSTGFFKILHEFYGTSPKKEVMALISKIVLGLVTYFFDTTIEDEAEMTSEEILNLISSTPLSDYDYAYDLLKNGLRIYSDDDFWYSVMYISSYPESSIITFGINILIWLAKSNFNADLIFGLTNIFEETAKLCARGNIELQKSILLLISRIIYKIGEESFNKFVELKLSDLVFSFIQSNNNAVRIAAFNCYSNIIASAAQRFDQILINKEILDYLITMLNDSSYDEQNQIIWIILNSCKLCPELIIQTFIENQLLLDKIIEFLSSDKTNTIILILDNLYFLLNINEIDTQEFSSLIINSGVLEAIQSLQDVDDDNIYYHAQILHNFILDIK